ncbi:MAG TPA: hypothetical protein VM537_32515 [Anaerolineae bacterium]|nr:hypothetical protein [Anaerolineae bacterium]
MMYVVAVLVGAAVGVVLGVWLEYWAWRRRAQRERDAWYSWQRVLAEAEGQLIEWEPTAQQRAVDTAAMVAMRERQAAYISEWARWQRRQPMAAKWERQQREQAAGGEARGCPWGHRWPEEWRGAVETTDQTTDPPPPPVEKEGGAPPGGFC